MVDGNGLILTGALTGVGALFGALVTGEADLAEKGLEAITHLGEQHNIQNIPGVQDWDNADSLNDILGVHATGDALLQVNADMDIAAHYNPSGIDSFHMEGEDLKLLNDALGNEAFAETVTPHSGNNGLVSMDKLVSHVNSENLEAVQNALSASYGDTPPISFKTLDASTLQAYLPTDIEFHGNVKEGVLIDRAVLSPALENDTHGLGGKLNEALEQAKDTTQYDALKTSIDDLNAYATQQGQGISRTTGATLGAVVGLVPGLGLAAANQPNYVTREEHKADANRKWVDAVQRESIGVHRV